MNMVSASHSGQCMGKTILVTSTTSMILPRVSRTDYKGNESSFRLIPNRSIVRPRLTGLTEEKRGVGTKGSPRAVPAMSF